MSGALDMLRAFARRDVARPPDGCQAAVRRKTYACRIKPHLPIRCVHKEGIRAALRHARLARLCTNGIVAT